MGAVLTVVVPIYNVGRYLAECLDSVAGQTYADLEVVLVDDGSTDDSAEIAARFCRDDVRFRLLRQANRGLGAARNAGIGLAGGDYLTFVDSDDVLPPYALEVLVGSLEQTGSDFASGNVALLTSRGLRQSPLHRGTHRVTRLRATLASQRNLVYDRLACNKVFRRSFWDRHGLRFPEGVRYEDIPLTIPAYALAKSVDVIDLPVYYWRQREAGAEQSISQRLGEVRNLVDRFAAVDSASRALAGLGDRKLKDWYDETALQSDLRMFLDLLPEGDDEYRQRFLELAVDFLDRVDKRLIDRLTPRLRVAWRLARGRALPELLDVVRAGRDGATPPVVRRGLNGYLQLPLLDAGHPLVPRQAYRVAPGIRTEVHQARWIGDRLQVSGMAYDVSRGAARPWAAPRMLWLREDSGRKRIVPLPTRASRVAAAPSSVPCDWSGFSVTLDAGRLRASDGWIESEWTFNIAVFPAGRPIRRMLGTGESRPVLPARWVDDGVRVYPYVRAGQLRLRVQRPRAWVTGARIDGGSLLIEGAAVRPPSTAVLRLTRVAGVTAFSFPVDLPGDGSGWSARIPLTDLAAAAVAVGRPVQVGEAGAGWRVSFDDGDGEPQELPVLARFTGLRHGLDGGELMVRPADDDVLLLRVLPPGPQVREVRADADAVVFTAELPDDAGSWDDLRIVLRRRDGAEPVDPAPADVELPVEVDPAARTVRFRLGRDVPAADGEWSPLYLRPGCGPVDLSFGVTAQRTSPRDVPLGGRRLELLPDRDRQVLRLSAPTHGD
jgi:glycosyltransferase involved in cell wall biosynthesis